MRRWIQRPFEIKNLFNPAFCGLVLFRALEGYEEEDDRGMPFSLTLLVLPLSLHKNSREILAARTRSYLLKISEQHPEVQVGLAERASSMLPHAFEGFGLLMERGCVSVTEEGRLKTTPSTVRKTLNGTDESRECQRVARFLGKQFARIGDRVTIYTSFGVRP